MRDFYYLSYAQEVIFAPGAIARTGDIVGQRGWQKLLLCTNRSARQGGHVAALQEALGDRLVLVFDTVHPHVQDIQVAEVLSLVDAQSIDAVIGLGGGSPIGMAKAVSSGLEQKHSGNAGQKTGPFEQLAVPVIAIPTTYAGSEMTAVYGVTQTREVPPRKVTVSDPKAAPKLIIYDPRLTLDLPPEMTASTGMNALAHCIEALYSNTRHPLSTAAAMSGVQHITHSLLACFQQGSDLEARSEMLLGAHLAGASLASVTMGLHHGLCHVLGGTANVPHGIANSIILPHAIRFNKNATASLLLPAAEAMGIPIPVKNPEQAVDSMADQIAELTRQMGLPQKLREVGVKESDLAFLADLAYRNKTVQNNPRPIRDPDEIEALLREAW